MINPDMEHDPMLALYQKSENDLLNAARSDEPLPEGTMSLAIAGHQHRTFPAMMKQAVKEALEEHNPSRRGKHARTAAGGAAGGGLVGLAMWLKDMWPGS